MSVIEIGQRGEFAFPKTSGLSNLMKAMTPVMNHSNIIVLIMINIVIDHGRTSWLARFSVKKTT